MLQKNPPKYLGSIGAVALSILGTKMDYQPECFTSGTEATDTVGSQLLSITVEIFSDGLLFPNNCALVLSSSLEGNIKNV